jgi:AcrR family transcriptional regulator
MDHSPQPLPKGKDTASSILDAAHQLFIEHGYHGTSMRLIAQEAEIALGGIYNHFPSKEALFEQIFLETHPYHEVLPILSEAQGDTPEALVRNAAQRMMQALQARPNFLKLMFVELVEFKGSHILDLQSAIFPQSAELIEQFTENSSSIRPIPAMILLRSFVGLFISYYLGELMLDPSGESKFDQQTFDQFIDIYLHGILSGAKE